MGHHACPASRSARGGPCLARWRRLQCTGGRRPQGGGRRGAVHVAAHNGRRATVGRLAQWAAGPVFASVVRGPSTPRDLEVETGRVVRTRHSRGRQGVAPVGHGVQGGAPRTPDQEHRPQSRGVGVPGAAARTAARTGPGAPTGLGGRVPAAGAVPPRGAPAPPAQRAAARAARAARGGGRRSTVGGVCRARDGRSGHSSGCRPAGGGAVATHTRAASDPDRVVDSPGRPARPGARTVCPLARGGGPLRGGLVAARARRRQPEQRSPPCQQPSRRRGTPATQWPALRDGPGPACSEQPPQGACGGRSTERGARWKTE